MADTPRRIITDAPLTPARFVDALLSADDPGEAVSTLAVQDLHALIEDAGIEYAVDLLALATPEQVQGVLDLALWRGDELDLAASRPWLAALVDGGYERLGEVWKGLDPELAALLLQRETRIYDLHEGEVPDDEEPPFFATPDRCFMVKITAPDQESVMLLDRLLDFLYRADQVLARHTLRAAASEPTSHLEEMALRWRSGRMADLGYADYYEALEVYRPIDLASVKVGETTATRTGLADTSSSLPVLVGARGAPPSFLAAAALRLTDDERAAFEAGLVLLGNRVLSADRIAPGAREDAARGIDRARATLALGLEVVARGDVDAGARALATISLTRLHRVGHSVGLQLGELVRALGPRAACAGEPQQTLLATLSGLRPLIPRLLDHPPGIGLRPLATRDDIRRVTFALARLGAELGFVHEVLGQDPAQLGAGVTLGDVGRSSVVRAALGLGFVFAPVRPKDLVKLRTTCFSDGKLTPEARAAVLAAAAPALRGRPPQLAEVLDGWLDEVSATGAAAGQSSPPLVLTRSDLPE